MMDTFEDLKLAPELVAGAETAGWDAPSGLQEDAMAVIRRGNNVVLHASAGSGVVGAWGLAILDRLTRAEDDDGAPAALILVPDLHAASATADSLARLATATDLTVRALAPGWAADGADVLVASAGAALDAVRASTLKLDAVTALVIHGADLLQDEGQWPAVETLVDTIPGDAQRVLVTGRFDDAIDDLIEGHIRRAMTVPPRSEPRSPAADAATVRYAVAPEHEKIDAAVLLLTELEGSTAVVCRTVDRADTVERALAGRGAVQGGDGDRSVVVLHRTEADQRSVQAAVLSYDVPFDADELAALHGKGGAVVVTPRERAHLLRIAGRAGLRTEAVATPAPPRRSAAEALRDRLRALAGTDLTPELALIEPLLVELPAVEVAAAAIRLARAGAEGQAAPGPATADTTAAPPTGSAPPPSAGTWVHLFMDIGKRDDVGPGDIVGAITGEAGVSGDRVGKIDIRESHSTVEIATEVAATVIEALNGRTLKGRSLRVDYDRKDRGTGGDRKDRGTGGDRKDRGTGGDRKDRGTGGDRRGGGRRTPGRER